MSRYSGRCDLYDWVTDMEENTPDITKLKLYTNDGQPIPIHKLSDLVPYYSWLVAVGMFSNGKSVIYLSRESSPDEEQRRHFECILDELKESHGELSDWWSHDDYAKEIQRRYKADPDHVTFDGIESPLHKRMREDLEAEYQRVLAEEQSNEE